MQLHRLGAGGQLYLLAQTTTAGDGSYGFDVEPGAGSALLITAQGGTFVDEASAQPRALNVPLRAFVLRTSGTQRVSPNPYSELAVRLVEQTASPWSPTFIHAANARVAQWLGVSQVLDFRPLDLQQPNLNLAGANPDDFGMSLGTSAFSMFARRLDTNPSTFLGGALTALYHLAEVDPADDRLFPAFLGGMVDTIDSMGLPDELKRELKTALLSDSTMTLGNTELDRIAPHGVASGAATATMADDVLHLLGSPGGRTTFNKRGALIGFTTSAPTPDWQVLYTASVAELFGDGEVGIGRWNGGAIISSVNVGGTFQPALIPLPYDALHYAVATNPVDVPFCGTRRLALTAHTTPTLLSDSVGAQRDFVELTPDSGLSLQYLGGDIYLGADIGVRLADNSIVRYRSAGGLDAPWASVRPIDVGPVPLSPVAPAGPLANKGMAVTIEAAGAGAHKAAARIDVQAFGEPTRTAAVFIAPAGAPEPQGCATAGMPGPGINPVTTDGEHHVFVSFNGQDMYLGAPLDATFGMSGQLQTIVGRFAFGGPAYDLAGNADVSIGRVSTIGLVNGRNVTRSTPYAVVRPGATLPTSGTVHYDLIHATAVTADRGDALSEVPPGTVTSATLSISYGEYPVGTPSPWYGTASLRVEGEMGGLAFQVGDPNSAAPSQARMLGEVFNEGVFKGAVGLPDGELAAVQFRSGVVGVGINGTLLFRRRP